MLRFKKYLLCFISVASLLLPTSFVSVSAETREERLERITEAVYCDTFNLRWPQLFSANTLKKIVSASKPEQYALLREVIYAVDDDDWVGYLGAGITFLCSLNPLLGPRNNEHFIKWWCASVNEILQIQSVVMGRVLSDKAKQNWCECWKYYKWLIRAVRIMVIYTWADFNMFYEGADFEKYPDVVFSYPFRTALLA